MSITAFQQTFEIAPIFLVGGIAQGQLNDQMPITNLTQPGGVNGLEYNDYFAHFNIIPGGTISEWAIAEYPFANMQVAANAVIQQPLRISLKMICPAQTNSSEFSQSGLSINIPSISSSQPLNNYTTKLNTITSIQNQIQNHISQGGYFIVYTPAFVYQNVLLKSIRDVTPAGDKQVQFVWQWDFEQPLISLSNASTSLGNVMSGAQNGTPTPTSWSNTSTPNFQ